LLLFFIDVSTPSVNSDESLDAVLPPDALGLFHRAPFIARAENHLRFFLSQSASDGEADACGASRDYGYFILET